MQPVVRDMLVLLAFTRHSPEHTGMTGVPTGAGPLHSAAGRATGISSSAQVRAVLGPTNTGKTHLAIERMLAHASGIIGFPLRLLARENYDRMVARKGVGAVALITGEEKIAPPNARWFSCTVEAMPLDRRVAFVAVDEIQLCADPDRGHIFTDRLLHARGQVETMFLGADTIRPLLRRLVPGIEIEHRPRLSHLAYTGASKLTRLPPRSAIVAFSAAEVYAIAELIRRRRGGCAIVMGQLSPRTRNAQVALYQNKEVDYLVATDAIGMGLNMDVNHVAFASLSKFDGTRMRPLTPAEIAQVAGRAGRGLRDGTFGTTAMCRPLSEDVAEAVEEHRFDPLARLSWRNSDLDFSSPDALLSSLGRSPPRPELTAGHEASDVLALASLAASPEIRTMARSRAATRLLWESCQIPDFRKLGDDSHIRLCARIFSHVIRDGRVPPAWMDGQIAAFLRPEGTIDSLMHRLSGIRVCAYIAARPDWLRNAEYWQERTRDAENQLSDALHAQLTARFVDRRAATLIRRLDEGSAEDLLSAVTAQGDVLVEGHPVGRIAGLELKAEGFDEPDRRLLMRAARRAVRTEIPRRVHVLAHAPDSCFGFAQDGRHLMWEGENVARLRHGHDLLHPRIEVLDNPLLDNVQRERIRERLHEWLDRHVREVLAPLFAAQAAVPDDPMLRGILHRLMEDGGVTMLARDEARSRVLHGHLGRLGIRMGHLALFMPALMKPRCMRLRAILTCAHMETDIPELPAASVVSVPHDMLPATFMDRMGWMRAGPVRIRADIADRLVTELTRQTRHHPVPLSNALASRLSIRRDAIQAVLKGLEIHVRPTRPLHPAQFGPPAPAMLVGRLRRAPAHSPAHAAAATDIPGQSRRPTRGRTATGARKHAPMAATQHRQDQADHPFAVLAVLRERRS